MMSTLARYSALMALLLAIPVIAEDKVAPKGDEKKPESKEAKKEAPRKAQVLNKVAAKIVKVDTDDKTLTVEVVALQRRSARAAREEIPYADDVKVRILN